MPSVTDSGIPPVHRPEYYDPKPSVITSGIVHDYGCKRLAEGVADLPPAKGFFHPVFSGGGKLHVTYAGQAVAAVRDELLPRAPQDGVTIQDGRFLEISDFGRRL